MISDDQMKNFYEYRSNENSDLTLEFWLVETNRIDKAIELIRHRIKILSDLGQHEYLGRYHNNLGWMYDLIHKWPDAIDEFIMAYKEDTKKYGIRKARKMLAYANWRNLKKRLE